MTSQRDFSDGGLALIEDFVTLLEIVPAVEVDKHLSNLAVLVREFLKYASPDVPETDKDENAVAFVQLVRTRCLARKRPRKDHPSAPADA
jgi:hypothetical protein